MQNQKSATKHGKTEDLSQSSWKNLSKKKKFLAIMSLLLIISLMSNISIRVLSYYNPQGIAQIKVSNGQKYIEVQADDPFDIGYHTGYHTANEIISLKMIIFMLSFEFGSNYWDIKSRAQQFLPFITEEHILEMKGISTGATHRHGSPITFDDILIQNTFLDITYGQLIPSMDVLGCTSIAANNSDNDIIFGQNFDFNKIFGESINFVLIKDNIGADVFSARFGGMLALPIGKNSKNVSVLTTVVKVMQEPKIETPISCRSRAALEHSENITEFKDIFFDDNDLDSISGYHMTIIDEHHFLTASKVPGILNKNESAYQIRTNTFVNNSWQEFLVDAEYSKVRQNEAETQFVEKSTGNKITYEALMEILSSKPIICQTTEKITEIETLAFFTSSHFGRGNPADNNWGLLPF